MWNKEQVNSRQQLKEIINIYIISSKIYTKVSSSWKMYCFVLNKCCISILVSSLPCGICLFVYSRSFNIHFVLILYLFFFALFIYKFIYFNFYLVKLSKKTTKKQNKKKRKKKETPPQKKEKEIRKTKTKTNKPTTHIITAFFILNKYIWR